MQKPVLNALRQFYGLSAYSLCNADYDTLTTINYMLPYCSNAIVNQVNLSLTYTLYKMDTVLACEGLLSRGETLLPTVYDICVGLQRVLKSMITPSIEEYIEPCMDILKLYEKDLKSVSITDIGNHIDKLNEDLANFKTNTDRLLKKATEVVDIVEHFFMELKPKLEILMNIVRYNAKEYVAVDENGYYNKSTLSLLYNTIYQYPTTTDYLENNNVFNITYGETVYAETLSIIKNLRCNLIAINNIFVKFNNQFSTITLANIKFKDMPAQDVLRLDQKSFDNFISNLISSVERNDKGKIDFEKTLEGKLDILESCQRIIKLIHYKVTPKLPKSKSDLSTLKNSWRDSMSVILHFAGVRDMLENKLTHYNMYILEHYGFEEGFSKNIETYLSEFKGCRDGISLTDVEENNNSLDNARLLQMQSLLLKIENIIGILKVSANRPADMYYYKFIKE